MALSRSVRQAYRGYGVATVLWAGWSAIWLGTGLQMNPSIIGYGWLAIAAVGAVLAVTMASMRYSSGYQLFQTQRRQGRIDRFNSHIFSSTPLHLYIVAMAAWSFLTVGWAANLDLVGRMVIGYGWLAIALYGLGLTVGLSVKHKSDLVEAADDVTPAAVGPDSS